MKPRLRPEGEGHCLFCRRSSNGCSVVELQSIHSVVALMSMYLYRCRRTATTVNVELTSLSVVCDLYMYLYRCRRTVTTVSVELTSLSVVCDRYMYLYRCRRTVTTASVELTMGAGTGGAGWASAHPGKNQGGHGPPWKF